jgi:hypothetical protein
MLAVAATGSHSDLLQIRQPAPARLVVGVADIIAGRRFFSAYVTCFSHGISLLAVMKTHLILLLASAGKLFVLINRGSAQVSSVRSQKAQTA